MSPCSGSQFSFFGAKASPYFASTSGVSRTSDFVSIRWVKRSMFTCTLTRSDSACTSHWIGSIMPWA